MASVPASVNIPAGALSADIPLASNSQGQATITAALNGGIAQAQVTVAPAELAQPAVSPAPGSAYQGEALQFSATGTMTDGTTHVGHKGLADSHVSLVSETPVEAIRDGAAAALVVHQGFQADDFHLDPGRFLAGAPPDTPGLEAPAIAVVFPAPLKEMGKV